MPHSHRVQRAGPAEAERSLARCRCRNKHGTERPHARVLAFGGQGQAGGPESCSLQSLEEARRRHYAARTHA